ERPPEGEGDQKGHERHRGGGEHPLAVTVDPEGEGRLRPHSRTGRCTQCVLQVGSCPIGGWPRAVVRRGEPAAPPELTDSVCRAQLFSSSRNFWTASCALAIAASTSPPVMATTIGSPTISRASATEITRGRS